MRGLGTASCGPDALPQYRIEPGRYRLDLILAAGATTRDPGSWAADLRS